MNLGFKRGDRVRVISSKFEIVVSADTFFCPHRYSEEEFEARWKGVDYFNAARLGDDTNSARMRALNGDTECVWIDRRGVPYRQTYHYLLLEKVDG